MNEDLAKEIFLITESCPDPMINISDSAWARIESIFSLFTIIIIFLTIYIIRQKVESNKDWEITRLTEELSKARNTSKEWAAHHREKVDQNISMMYEISTLKEMNERLKDMNERQAGRLKFFRGLGCTLPSDDLEVDDTPTDEE